MRERKRIQQGKCFVLAKRERLEMCGIWIETVEIREVSIQILK